MSIIYSSVVTFVLVLLPFVVMSIITGMLEKQLVWSYGPLEGTDATPPYTLEVNRDAEALGFTPLGALADARGKIYRIRYDFWLSLDRNVLCVIGAGSLASIPVRSIRLTTRLADGHRLVTLNRQAASEPDLAGISREMLVADADLQLLVQRHRARLEASPSPPIPYTREHVLDEHRASLAERIERMDRKGYIAYVDRDRTVWRYSLRGSVVLAVRAYSRAIRRTFFADRVKGIRG